MTGVLERLRQANPVTDLDDVSSGVRPAPRPDVRRAPRPPRGRASLRVLAAGAAIAALVVLAGDSGNGPSPLRGVDVATAAARALDPGRAILHVALHTTQRGPDVADGTSRSDIWLAPGGKSGRVRSLAPDGAVLGDTVIRPAGANPGILDPISAVRAALRDGELTPAGQTTRTGRVLQRFRSRSGEVTWYFDAKTLTPVQSVLHPRAGHGRFVATTTITTYERLPPTAANRQLLTPQHEIAPRPAGHTSPQPTSTTSSDEP